VANPELDYVAIPVGQEPVRELLIVAAGLAEAFLTATGIQAPAESWIRIPREGFRTLEGTRYQPPFPRAKGDPERDYRLWFARHATLEAGTGLVHTAPGHGADDYLVGRDHGLAIFAPVDEQGRLTAEAAVDPALHGLRVFEANPKIVQTLADRGLLLNKPGEPLRHQYPRCWRGDNPIIFRATE